MSAPPDDPFQPRPDEPRRPEEGGSRREPDPAGGYGQPSPAQYGQGGYPGGAPRNGLGTAALVLGIVGFLLSILLVGALLGLVAIVLGIVALGRVRRREATNRRSAIAGIVLGGMSFFLPILLVAVGASFISNNKEEVGNLRDCLQSAGDDRAAQRQCQQEFQRDVTG